MIPTIDELTDELYTQRFYDKTYRVNIPNDIVQGATSDVIALQQTIYFILGTERYQFPIYSWDYGVELADLFGRPIKYVKPELKRRITEALLQDNRITDVTDFEFEEGRNTLHTTFVVHSTLNTDIKTEIEVKI